MPKCYMAEPVTRYLSGLNLNQYHLIDTYSFVMHFYSYKNYQKKKVISEFTFDKKEIQFRKKPK